MRFYSEVKANEPNIGENRVLKARHGHFSAIKMHANGVTVLFWRRDKNHDEHFVCVCSLEEDKEVKME